jgi:hypothetical protein
LVFLHPLPIEWLHSLAYFDPLWRIDE